MKIGFIGNINNVSFLIAEGLRGIGVDTRLLLTRSDPLHHPVGSGLVEELPHWVYDASSLSLQAFEQQNYNIGEALNFVTYGAELAVLNDVGPSLHNLLNMPVATLLTGSDLTFYGTLSSGLALWSGWSPDFAQSAYARMYMDNWEKLVLRQRAAIRHSLAVVYPRRGVIPSSDLILDEIGVVESQRIYLPGIDTVRIRPKIKNDRGPLRILNGARLNWVDPLPPGYFDQDHKGTDILLHGFADLLRSGHEAQLILIEKGLHVAETRRLTEQLGIAEHIVWKSELNLAEYYVEMSEADVVCCNFGRSTVGQAGFGGMAAGKPVLANFSDVQGMFETDWPTCDVRSVSDVSRHLSALCSDFDYRQELGRRARIFAERHLSMQSVGTRLLQKISGRLRHPDLDSLLASLNEAERS